MILSVHCVAGTVLGCAGLGWGTTQAGLCWPVMGIVDTQSFNMEMQLAITYNINYKYLNLFPAFCLLIIIILYIEKFFLPLYLCTLFCENLLPAK